MKQKWLLFVTNYNKRALKNKRVPKWTNAKAPEWKEAK